MSNDMIPLLTKALGETVYMVAVSMAIASALGIPLGVLLYTTDKGQILESPTLNKVIGTVVNRQVETSLKEVPYGLIEAALSMGATPMQIISRVLLPESMPSIVAQLTTVVISLVGESAMAGAIGGGGLGDLAIRYGYQRFRPEVMIATVIILIVLVQAVQFVGNTIAKHLDKK